MELLTSAMGIGARLFGVTQTAAEAARGAAKGLATLPRLVDVLERLADEAATLRALVNAAPSLDRLAAGIRPVERLAEGTAAFTRIAESIPLIERLVEQAGASPELRAVPKALDSLLETTRLMQPLADAVHELNRAVATLNSTVSPLQGTAERLGRLVDRLPASRRRAGSTPIAPPFVAPADADTDA